MRLCFLVSGESVYPHTSTVLLGEFPTSSGWALGVCLNCALNQVVSELGEFALDRRGKAKLGQNVQRGIDTFLGQFGRDPVGATGVVDLPDLGEMMVAGFGVAGDSLEPRAVSRCGQLESCHM